MEKTEFPRVKLENHHMNDDDRFELKIICRNPTIASDGSIRVFLDRGDVSNLQFDCSASLLDDDLALGVAQSK